MTRPSPSFSVTNLRPATAYKVTVTAVNHKGASRATQLKAYTSRVLELQEETSAGKSKSPSPRAFLDRPLVSLSTSGHLLFTEHPPSTAPPPPHAHRHTLFIATNCSREETQVTPHAHARLS